MIHLKQKRKCVMQFHWEIHVSPDTVKCLIFTSTGMPQNQLLATRKKSSVISIAPKDPPKYSPSETNRTPKKKIIRINRHIETL